MWAQIYRIIDANFNRVKEGLRVVEEYYRFIDNNKDYTHKIKTIRHKLSQILISNNLLKECINARDAAGDVLSDDMTETEKTRDSVDAVLFANFQRVKEGLRVLEEYLKLISGEIAIEIQRIRFNVYELEQCRV